MIWKASLGCRCWVIRHVPLHIVRNLWFFPCRFFSSRPLSCLEIDSTSFFIAWNDENEKWKKKTVQVKMIPLNFRTRCPDTQSQSNACENQMPWHIFHIGNYCVAVNRVIYISANGWVDFENQTMRKLNDARLMGHVDDLFPWFFHILIAWLN